ncbi:MAG: hypothetical protein LUH10_00525 [Tannerellaceae bacterium]|nr:hypothetical protein [Tannerellaceae bacterium]
MRKNYLELVKLISNICLAHPLVNDVHYGIYHSSQCENIEYGAIILTPGSMDTTVNTIEYNFNLMYVDRLKADESNELEVQSNGIDVIRGIISVIAEHHSMLLDYEDTVNVNVFSRQFADNVAGAVAPIRIKAPSNLGECAWYTYHDEC